MAINILLVKLTIAGTDLLQERLSGGDNYVQTDDAGMLKLVRDITRTDDIFVTAVKEVSINQINQMSIKFNSEYEQGGESIHVIELESKMAIVVNPTRSAIVDDYMVDADGLQKFAASEKKRKTDPKPIVKESSIQTEKKYGSDNKKPI